MHGLASRLGLFWSNGGRQPSAKGVRLVGPIGITPALMPPPRGALRENTSVSSQTIGGWQTRDPFNDSAAAPSVKTRNTRPGTGRKGGGLLASGCWTTIRLRKEDNRKSQDGSCFLPQVAFLVARFHSSIVSTTLANLLLGHLREKGNVSNW